MYKQQAQNIIKDTFENPFDKIRVAGFVKNLLNSAVRAQFIAPCIDGPDDENRRRAQQAAPLQKNDFLAATFTNVEQLSSLDNTISSIGFPMPVSALKNEGWNLEQSEILALLEYKPMYIGTVPVFPALDKQKAPISERVQTILANPDSPDVPRLEAEINKLVYALYDLTPEEIALVEGKESEAK